MSESGRRRAISDSRDDYVVGQLDEEIQLVRRRIEELTSELSGSVIGSTDGASDRRRDVSPQSATSQMDYSYHISDELASSHCLPEISDIDVFTPSQHIFNSSSQGYFDEPAIKQREPRLNRSTYPSTNRYDDDELQLNHPYDIRVSVEPESQSINRSINQSRNVPDYALKPNRLIVNSTHQTADVLERNRPTNRSTNRSLNPYGRRSMVNMRDEPAARGRSPPPRASYERTPGNVDVSTMAYQRRALPTIKMETYNGSTSLETFLAKLKNCADYYQWSNKDILCHLKASLDGHAGQVL